MDKWPISFVPFRISIAQYCFGGFFKVRFLHISKIIGNAWRGSRDVQMQGQPREIDL
jgi:hypothetical protein